MVSTYTKIALSHVGDALAHTPTYDSLKGDFALARQLARSHLAEARRVADPTHLADALLACGIVHLLQGEPLRALDAFEEVDKEVAHDPVCRLRALTYTNLATYLRFNTFPDGNGATGIEIEARWNGIAHAEQYSARRDALLKQVDDPPALLENKLINELLVNILPARSFVSNPQRARAEMAGQLLEAAFSAPRSFRRVAETLNAWPGYLAYADWIAADLCRRARQMEQAHTLLNQAQAIYEQAGDDAGAACCHLMRGDWLAAPTTSPLVWNFVLQEGNEDSALSWTVEQNEFGGAGVNVAGAQAAYAQAESLFAAAGARRGLAAVRLRRGYLAALGSDFDQATQWLAEVEEIFAGAGDTIGVRLTQAHRALSLIGAGRLPEPTEVAAAIGAWGMESGCFSLALGIGLMFNRAGRYWLTRRGDYQRALACYRLAQALFTELGALSNAAQSLVDQGAAYQIIGEPASATTLYEEARAVYDQYRQRLPSEASIPLKITLRWRVVHLEQAIYRIYENHRNTQGMSKSLQRLRNLASQPQPALTEESDSQFDVFAHLALTQQLTSLVESAEVLLPRFRAVEARNAGNEREANYQFELALAAAQRASPGQRDLLAASVYGQQRRYAEAIALFRRYLEGGGAMGGFTGSLANLLSSFFGAEGQAVALRQNENTHEQAALFFTVTKAYDEAKKHFDALEQIAGPEWWRRNARPWETLLDYGEVHEGLGQLAEAMNYYERAIAELDRQRGTLSRDELKIALASGIHAQRIYFGAARTAVRLGDFERGFALIERGKARALFDLMAASAVLAAAAPASHTDLSNPRRSTAQLWRRLTAQLATWRGLLANERSQDDPNPQRISYLQEQITADEQQLRQVERELAADQPELYRALNQQSELPPLNAVVESLPPDTVLLEYAFLDEDLLVWAVTRNGVLQVRQVNVDEKALERQIRQLHQACAERRPLHEINEIASALATVFLEPVDDLLATHSNVIISAYGAAHLLPFNVLPWQGEPLIATHRLSSVPSASVLPFLTRSRLRRRPDRLLAVGNPANMSYRPFAEGEPRPAAPLPSAELEALYVASLFPQGRALVGAQATAATVSERLGDYPFILLATHGILSEEAPLLSSILLANGDALTVYELMGLRLHADLVVLSACQTGRGQGTGGDDVVGLTRGLLAVGVRAAVVSLWPVHDLSTSLFMGQFFRRLRAGSTPAVALQEAQRYLYNLNDEEISSAQTELKATLPATTAGQQAIGHLLRDLTPEGASSEETSTYQHPFYWAPFMLVG